jgi:hypothetical protein
VNEVVLPIGLKNAFNNLTPDKDATVMAAVDRVSDPEVPRDDLVSAFLTGIEGLNKPPKVTPAEIVRLNTKIPPAEGPSRLGVLDKDNQGFPNGRRLIDDVVDIELQVLAGAIRTEALVPALAAGDGVDSNDLAFEEAFPYVALPHSGSGPASAGFGSGSDAAAGPDTPSASPSADAGAEDSDTDVDSSPTSGESDGVSTGLLVGGVVLALLIGLGVGTALGRRRGTDATA